MSQPGKSASASILELKPFYAVNGPFAASYAPFVEDISPESPQRTRLWDLHSSLHCSIVGTCFTTAELRQILQRAGFTETEKRSDHDLHSQAVALACKRSGVSKLLHKALDRKHRSAIAKFAHLDGRDQVHALWRECVKNGEIPGAYWAVLTHIRADEELIRSVFGDVHMLSHLVGAANRADIRRLRDLEEENAVLHDKIQRQQVRIREAVVKREETIQSLKDALANALAERVVIAEPEKANAGADQLAASSIIADLKGKLERQITRSECLEGRLLTLNDELAREKKSSADWEKRSAELTIELEAIESAFFLGGGEERREEVCNTLAGMTLLYVGGRAHQVSHLKQLAENYGAFFMHHDGGLEDHSQSLVGMAGRADAIVFPVDCISHAAAATVKRVCKQLGKAYFPLRSSGLTSFAGLIPRLK